MQLDLQKNFFELFGIDVDFQLDQKQLHAAQQRLQSTYHPDRFINASDQEKRMSVQNAAHVNEAYETLKNPVKRAQYMLQVGGLDVQNDHETTSDTTFLMEQIEFREEMEECRSCKDPMRACSHITGKLDQRSKEFSNQFELLYQQGRFEDARQVSKKMQFVERILEQIDDIQIELEDGLF